MTETPWTIERIGEALGSPRVTQRFLRELNRATADNLLDVFTRWQTIAEDTLAAIERGREITAAEAQGEEPPGEWIDVTDLILEEAARIRSQGAA